MQSIGHDRREVPFDPRDGGPCPCIRAGKTWHVDTGAHTAAPILVSESGETQKAAHRFSAIRMRSLNDPRQSALLHLKSGASFRDRRLNDRRSAARLTRSTGTDASVTTNFESRSKG
jgi:hypothetical protein